MSEEKESNSTENNEPTTPVTPVEEAAVSPAPEAEPEVAVAAPAEEAVVEANVSKEPAKVEEAPVAEKAPRNNTRRRNTPQRRDQQKREEEEGGLTEKVVFINRCAKVVKGGRRFSFSALIVVGDGEGQVGIGFGKANEVAECIRKANEDGRKNMQKINLEEATIPHEVMGEFGGSRVFMRPASAGTGLIAGGGVRAVAEAAGVKDLLAKSLGSDNPSNVAKAALDGLKQLAHKEEFLLARGKN
ncbi:MAG: 30S ribosomal protein S5 [Verrucomicrobiota bacterium]